MSSPKITRIFGFSAALAIADIDITTTDVAAVSIARHLQGIGI
jgi:hypothetical protein